jgi:hypothetical protein
VLEMLQAVGVAMEAAMATWAMLEVMAAEKGSVAGWG